MRNLPLLNARLMPLPTLPRLLSGPLNHGILRAIGWSRTLVALAIMVAPASYAEQSAEADSLADLTLEELANIQVSSVQKKSERAGDSPAAVFVITQDDIRRSGATSIPQALRLVPGLQVAQIDGNKWAISARGFNSRFANRLLVLMDGRTLYTLTFGGVFWDAQDTVIQDIERIEVIRGPGGTVWGSNAFNGVINIITKNASQTVGGLVAVDTGTHRPVGGTLRYGSDDGALKWRAFAKGYTQRGNRNWLDQDASDDWRTARIGGRADWEMADGGALQLVAEAYTGKSGMDLWDYDALPSFATVSVEDEYRGAFAVAEWTLATESAGRVGVRGVIDYTDRESLVFDETRRTYDLELQHNLPEWRRNSVMWGLGVRYTKDATDRTAIEVVPASDSLTTVSGFVQDEISLLNDALHLTVGGKIEHSDFIGTQFMPNLRVRYSFNEDTVVWSAISRGIRSASRLERDVRVGDTIPSATIVPGAAPFGVEIWGDPDFAPEKLLAYELGVRQRFNDLLSVDLSTYYNRYSDMRGVRLLPTVCMPSMTLTATSPFCIFTATKVVLPLQYTNLLSGDIWGAELTVTWHPLRNWRLIGSYAYLDQRFDDNIIDFGNGAILDFGAYEAGLDAPNQWTLRSSVSLGTRWDWDVLLRHLDSLPAAEVPAYTELNTRIAWRPRIDFELALVGENLLDKDHLEFVSDFIDLSPVSIERSVHLQARWTF